MKDITFNINKVALHLLYWICFTITFPFFYTLFYYFSFSTELLRLQFISLLYEHIYLIPSTYLFTYYLIPRLLLKKKVLTFLIISPCILIILAVIDDLMSIYIFIPKYIPESLSSFKKIAFTPSHIAVVGTILYFQMQFFASVKYLKEYFSSYFEKENLKKEISDTKLSALTMQLHPHFLFNTLNNIYFLSLESKNPILPKSIERISSILRYTLYDCNNALTQLQNEIKIINDYIELEKMRYSNITIESSFPKDNENTFIIPLLLFTFVENAFKHGTSKAIKNKWIKMDLSIKNKILHFIIRNSKSFNKTSKQNQNVGIGLQNAKKRLDLFYGSNNYSLTIEDNPETFEINLKIDLRHKS